MSSSGRHPVRARRATRAVAAIGALGLRLSGRADHRQDSTLYDGVRHLLFIYPVLVVLAASGWTAWLRSHRPWVRRGAAAMLVGGLVNVVAFDVRFHPNETVYFNELVGGPRGAFAKYEMDYWGNCVLKAVAWSARRPFAGRLMRSQAIRGTWCSSTPSVSTSCPSRLRPALFTWTCC